MGARTWLSCSAVLLALLNPARAADFEIDIEQLSELSPPPSSTISADNLGLYTAFIDRDFARFVKSGAATLMIGEPLSFPPPDAYIEATTRYRGHARLGDNPGMLDGYKQGRPFSGALDTNDPKAGTKAAWNMRYAYAGDSSKLAEIRWQMRDWESTKVQAEMLFEGRSMRLRYRHVQLPGPAITNNPHDAFAAFFMRAVDAGSYNGTEILVFANRDGSRPLNGAVYLAQTGRTQTLASFSTEEAMFGSDIGPSDFLTYSGPRPAQRWRYLGSSFTLLPLYRHDQIDPAARKAHKHAYWHVDFGGHGGCFPKVRWQLRPTLILEATALDPAAVVTRRVFYLDAQTYMPAMWKIYQGEQQLSKFVINAYAHPDFHMAENRGVGAPILSAASSIDISANRCTSLQLLTLLNPSDVTAADFGSSDMQNGAGAHSRRH